MTGYSVSTSGLGVSYGRTAALTDVTIDLAPDRIHGLLGRNGAGKSTLLSTLASLRAPSAGTVKAFRFGVGDQVGDGAELVEFEVAAA